MALEEKNAINTTSKGRALKTQYVRKAQKQNTSSTSVFVVHNPPQRFGLDDTAMTLAVSLPGSHREGVIL